jgi:hypothetical protein
MSDIDPRLPCDAPAGSEEKIVVMIARAAAKIALFDARDSAAVVGPASASGKWARTSEEAKRRMVEKSRKKRQALRALAAPLASAGVQRRRRSSPRSAFRRRVVVGL